MRKIFLTMCGIASAFSATAADAQVHVQGHYRKDGTYVRPHMRSSPNSTTSDNWSTKGNVNPYTGAEGTRNPYPQQRQYQPTYPQSTTPQYNPQQPYNQQRTVRCTFGTIC